MFNFLRPDPVKRKKQRYNSMLESAMLAQRRGDIMTYSMVSAEAETLWGEIEALEQSRKTA